MTRKQTQADLISIPVYRPKMRETTALGAAIAAGLACGIWNSFAELRDINRAGGTVFESSISREESASKFGQWEKAVRMSRGWVGSNDIDEPARSTEAQTNGAPTISVERRDDSVLKTPKPAFSWLISDIATMSGLSETPNVKKQTLNGRGFSPAKAPLISVFGDLDDDADEEDLIMELRKVEILQKLKKLRKLKLSYY